MQKKIILILFNLILSYATASAKHNGNIIQKNITDSGLIDSNSRGVVRLLSIDGFQKVEIDSTKPLLILDSTKKIIGFIDKNGNVQICAPYKPSTISLVEYLQPFLVFLLICISVVIVFFIVRSFFKAKENNTDIEESSSLWKYYITKVISLVLLITFVLGLFGLFFANCFIDNTTHVNEKWFEIFKNFLLLLGTSFTTIMGYFFGQGQAEKLEKNNSKLEQQKDELKNKINIVEELTESLRKQRDLLANAASAATIEQEPKQL